MSVSGWSQIVLLLGVLTAATPLLGAYMARVYRGERVGLSAVLAPVERMVYRALRVDSSQGQDWREYARSVLVFSFLSWLACIWCCDLSPSIS